MRKEYIEPQIEIVEIDGTDIICISHVPVEPEITMGEDLDDEEQEGD